MGKLINLVLLFALNVFAAGSVVAQTRPTGPKKETAFKIGEPLEFKGRIVSGSLLVLGVVALARALPGWWVLPAGVAAALAALLLSFLAPVLLAPMFNRYTPLRDEPLATELRALATAADVPVADVLIEDTSRRTRKQNAYVTGLGRTRRIVVSDTLLAAASPAELRTVVAHELGHRRKRHVLLGSQQIGFARKDHFEAQFEVLDEFRSCLHRPPIDRPYP